MENKACHITCVIITLNEENNIKRCLESVKWTDEIVVVDSGSIDKTKEICLAYNCKLIETTWFGFGLTKQYAVQNSSNDWILSIDADEVVTPELKEEMINLLKTEPKLKGYRIKRNSFYLGKLIKHCGWNRDYTLRLFNKQYGSFNDKLVHESVQIKGKVGVLIHPMLHYTYPKLESHFVKMLNYSELGAVTLSQVNKTSSIYSALFRGCLKFLKMYILQLGILDGKHGFLLSYNSAWGVYLKYILLWEKTKSK